MTESTQELVTLDDFDAICRVCLQSHDDMIDIFGSGMDNQLMEITKLKVRSDDKLPKALCQSCRVQMDYFAEFQQKAKVSDKLLRSLLINNEKNKIDEKGSFISKLKTSKANTHKRKPRLLERKMRKGKKSHKDNSHNKMYLIVVPNAGEDDASDVKNEICIKDLNVGNDNPELTHYCKNLVKNYFVDHSYPKDHNYQYRISTMESFNAQETESDQTENNMKSMANTDVIHKVNLCIFQCKECEQSFDESYDLSSHYLISHNIEEPFTQHFSYNCPVCDFHIVRKNNFLEHLLKHKKNGYQFVKVDSEGKSVPVKESETNIFHSLSLESSAKENFNVFKLDFESLKCSICSDIIECSQIAEHLKLYHEKKSVNCHYEKYVCPICSIEFFNQKNKFMLHLKSHKSNNMHFIKVNNNEEAIHLNADQGDPDVFIPYKEAVNIIKVINGSHKVFPITDIYTCNKCEYSGESFQPVNDHYFQEHSEVYTLESSVFCPVCHEEFKVPDIKAALYEHLKTHKNEDLFFIEITKSGSLKNIVKDHSDIFTQSTILYCLSIGLLTAGVNQIWCPDLVILGTKGISHETEGDSFDQLVDNDKHFLKSVFSDGNEGGKNNESIVCEKCGETFEGKSNYKKHYATHLKNDFESKGKRPVCSICRKTFANRTSLTCHMRNHIKEGSGNSELESFLSKIICEECGKSFSNHTSLTKHKRVHKTEKENVRLKCAICNREFLRQSSFDRHMAAHLNPKYFDCDVCKLPLSSVASLQKHAELHKTSSNTFDCKACKTSFLTKDSLTAHQTHTGHYQDRKPLECNVCHEKFYIGRKFTEHIKKHPKYKMGECTLCGKKLSTVQSLMLHMGRHFESNSILCPHCGKQFFEERNYHRHLLTHEGIKPFSCDVEGCEKSFYTLFELNRHKKYHSNTRDFICPYCGKSFHEANHLTVHVRTHTGERPYICPHCSKGFITRTRCKHHIKLVHQGIGYDLIQSTISKKVTVFEAVETIV